MECVREGGRKGEKEGEIERAREGERRDREGKGGRDRARENGSLREGNGCTSIIHVLTVVVPSSDG